MPDESESLPNQYWQSLLCQPIATSEATQAKTHVIITREASQAKTDVIITYNADYSTLLYCDCQVIFITVIFKLNDNTHIAASAIAAAAA